MVDTFSIGVAGKLQAGKLAGFDVSFQPMKRLTIKLRWPLRFHEVAKCKNAGIKYVSADSLSWIAANSNVMPNIWESLKCYKSQSVVDFAINNRAPRSSDQIETGLAGRSCGRQTCCITGRCSI
jgi:hypothetical protein